MPSDPIAAPQSGSNARMAPETSSNKRDVSDFAERADDFRSTLDPAAAEEIARDDIPRDDEVEDPALIEAGDGTDPLAGLPEWLRKAFLATEGGETAKDTPVFLNRIRNMLSPDAPPDTAGAGSGEPGNATTRPGVLSDAGGDVPVSIQGGPPKPTRGADADGTVSGVGESADPIQKQAAADPDLRTTAVPADQTDAKTDRKDRRHEAEVRVSGLSAEDPAYRPKRDTGAGSIGPAGTAAFFDAAQAKESGPATSLSVSQFQTEASGPETPDPGPTQADPSRPSPESRISLPNLRENVAERAQTLVRAAKADGIQIRTGDGDLSTELELAPADLGRLRLVLNTSERGLHLSVIVDRPDSIDAVRRHLEGLQRQFLADGVTLDSVDIGAGDRGSGDRGPAMPEPDRAEKAEPLAKQDLPVSTPITSDAVPKGRLDLRL